MTSKLTSEILDDETLAELIAFRRSRVEYCQKEGLPYQKALHDSMMLALEELQERRKVERDTEPYGFTDGDRRGMIYKPEHSDRLSEPVPVYRHAQPAPLVPDEMLCEFYEVDSWPDLVRELVKHVEQLQDSAKRNVKPWEDTFPETLLPVYIEKVKQADEVCRAAMLQAKSLTSINPAPALVSLPKNAKSLTGNSPVNDVTAGKPLTIFLPDISSKAFWSGAGKNETFHPETYRRWAKEAIERGCIIACIDVEVK